MWNKIKTIFSIIGAVLSTVFFTVTLFLLRRSSSDRQRSTGDVERDRRIKDGLESSQGRTDTIERESTECEGRISNAENGIGRCEEHLRRADEILRGAIDRSRKEE